MKFSLIDFFLFFQSLILKPYFALYFSIYHSLHKLVVCYKPNTSELKKNIFSF